VPKGSLGYIDYITTMKDTQFAPCPAGGSAETYRLFEALETGAIPVLVRQSSDRDFLSQWEGYPGPVLDSWSELKAYLQSMGVRTSVHTLTTDGEVDAEIGVEDQVEDQVEVNNRLDQLQRDIRVWYEAFKTKTKRRINDRLFDVFRNIEP
jgi:hypothetical protein